MKSVKGKAYTTKSVRSAQSSGIIAAYVDDENPQRLFVAVVSSLSRAENNNSFLGHRDSSATSKEEWVPHSSSFHTLRHREECVKRLEDGHLLSEEGVMLSVYRSFLPLKKNPYQMSEEEGGNEQFFIPQSRSSSFSPVDSSHFLLLQHIPLPFKKRRVASSSLSSSVTSPLSASGFVHSDAVYPSASSVNGAQQTPSTSHVVAVKENGEKCARDELQQHYSATTNQQADPLPRKDSMRSNSKDEGEDKASLEVDKLLWISPRILGVMNRNGVLCIIQTGVIPFHSTTWKVPTNGISQKETTSENVDEQLSSLSLLMFPVMSQVHDFTGCSIPALLHAQSSEMHLVKGETEKGNNSNIATDTSHPCDDDESGGVDIVFVLERNKGMKACLTFYWRAQKGLVTGVKHIQEEGHHTHMEKEVGQVSKNNTLEEYERVKTKVMRFPEERYHSLSVAVCYQSSTPGRKETEEEESTTCAALDERHPTPSSITKQGYLLLVGCSSQSTIVFTTRTMHTLSLLSRRELFVGPLYRMLSISISSYTITEDENTTANATHALGMRRLWVAVVASCRKDGATALENISAEGSLANGDGVTSLNALHSDSQFSRLLPSGGERTEKVEVVTRAFPSMEKGVPLSPPTLSAPSSFPSPLPFTLKGKDGRPLMVDVKTSVEEILRTPLPLNPSWRSASSSRPPTASAVAWKEAKGGVSPLSAGSPIPSFHPPTDPLPRASERCAGVASSALSLLVTPPDITNGEGVVWMMEWDLLSSALLTPWQEFSIPPSPLITPLERGKREEGGSAPCTVWDAVPPLAFSATPSLTPVSISRATLFRSPWTVRVLPRFHLQPATREADGQSISAISKGWEAHLVVFDGTSDGVATLVVPLQQEKKDACTSSFSSSPPLAAEMEAQLSCPVASSSRAKAKEGKRPLPLVHWEPMQEKTRTTGESDPVPNPTQLSLAAVESKEVILGIDEVHVSFAPSPCAVSSLSLALSPLQGESVNDPSATHDTSRSGNARVVERHVYRILLAGDAIPLACPSSDSLPAYHHVTKVNGGASTAHGKRNGMASFLTLRVWETTSTIALLEKTENRVPIVEASSSSISRRSLSLSGASSSLSYRRTSGVDAVKGTHGVFDTPKPSSPFALWHSLWKAFTVLPSSTERHRHPNLVPPPLSSPRSDACRRSHSHSVLLSHNARVAGKALRELLRSSVGEYTPTQTNDNVLGVGSTVAVQKDPLTDCMDGESSSVVVPSDPLDVLLWSSASPSRASYRTTVAGQVVLWMDVWEKMVANTNEESLIALLQLGESLWESLLGNA